jgi:cyclic pyranopterin phosphate synthase
MRRATFEDVSIYDARPRLIDAHGRLIDYLRVSVTDRCNLRCAYCMGSEAKFLPRSEVLTLEEIERVCAAFIRMGVKKLRLTGGEPLLRPGVVEMAGRLGRYVHLGALDELTVTTNGMLLAQYADTLARAGVRRINVSLDALSEAVFRSITGHDGLDQVLAGIDAARRAGIAVRINTVAIGGVNDGEFDSLLAWCGEHECDMALIELMPMGGARRFHGDALMLDTVRERLAQHWTLLPVAHGRGGPARYVRVAETGRRLGFITPLSHGFCRDCNRVRLTCAGELMLCLGHTRGVDLKTVLRSGAPERALEDTILDALALKPRANDFAGESGEFSSVPNMWQMGG